MCGQSRVHYGYRSHHDVQISAHESQRHVQTVNIGSRTVAKALLAELMTKVIGKLGLAQFHQTIAPKIGKSRYADPLLSLMRCEMTCETSL